MTDPLSRANFDAAGLAADRQLDALDAPARALIAAELRQVSNALGQYETELQRLRGRFQLLTSVVEQPDLNALFRAQQRGLLLDRIAKRCTLPRDLKIELADELARHPAIPHRLQSAKRRRMTADPERLRLAELAVLRAARRFIRATERADALHADMMSAARERKRAYDDLERAAKERDGLANQISPPAKQ